MTPLFQERQRFRQWWLWGLLTAVSVPLLATLGYGLWQQLVLGRPFGDHPPSNAGLLGISAGVFVVHGGVLALMWLAHLDTTVTPEEIVIRFRPFHWRPRRFPLTTVSDARKRDYRPLAEFGGWGIRFGVGGQAYNVSGSEGVQLTFADGGRLLIGSQRAGELEAAIREAMRA